MIAAGIAAGEHLRIYVATRPVDFRCGHDGLAALVEPIFGLDPFSGAAFVFRAKRADRIKILIRDETGLVLIHKRLVGCKFRMAAGSQRRDGSVGSSIFGTLFRP